MRQRETGNRRAAEAVPAVTGRLISQRGVTLIELLVVIGIITFILTIATLAFRQMKEKADIDAEARSLYADLMKARSEALYRRENRAVVLTGADQLSVFASSDGSGPVAWLNDYASRKKITTDNPGVLFFDISGMASIDKAFCVGVPGNDAGVDSVVVSTTSVMLGKLNGGSCSSANINPK